MDEIPIVAKQIKLSVPLRPEGLLAVPLEGPIGDRRRRGRRTSPSSSRATWRPRPAADPSGSTRRGSRSS
jgi:hypothetical protein